MDKKHSASETNLPPARKDGSHPPDLLPGEPGYRLREGRSGLDPIDANTEAGHTAGTFLRDLFTGRLIVRSPLGLIVLGLLGLGLVAPLLLSLVEIARGGPLQWQSILAMLIWALVGAALLVSFVRSLRR